LTKGILPFFVTGSYYWFWKIGIEEPVHLHLAGNLEVIVDIIQVLDYITLVETLAH